MIAKDPEMKSFWTSITNKAETGRTIFLIQEFQQCANSSFEILPSPDLLKMLNISVIKCESMGYGLPFSLRNNALMSAVNSFMFMALSLEVETKIIHVLLYFDLHSIISFLS